MAQVHKLSDGTTLKVVTHRTIAGTYFQEVPSRKRKASMLFRLESRMFLVFGNGQLIRITHNDYSYAASDREGAELALRFFAEGAEACIAEAAKEGLPVESMYGV